MQIALVIFLVLQVILLVNLFFPLALLLLDAMRSHQPVIEGQVGDEADYAFIVTAYQQTNLVPAVVNSILEIDYQNFMIYVVADNCDISELRIEDKRVIILKPEVTLANNIKSHFYAINNFIRPHTRLTIIDSDNLVDPQYLKQLNVLFDQGYQAVQGVRAAKNLNTNYACLDAAGDIYYRYIDRKLLYGAGSSASLSGSGMAFTTDLYRECLENLNNSGAGFDKILQYEILMRKLRIAFAEHAIVYDEKTSKSDQLVKQRARWINTWLKFFALGLKMSWRGIINFNLNQFLFSIMLLRPPLFILLILSFLSFLGALLFTPGFAIMWIAGAVSFFFIFFKSLSYFKTEQIIYDSLKSAPKFMFFQVLALLKAKKANQLSVATEHDQESSLPNVINKKQN